MATPKKRKPQVAGRKTRYRPENATIAKALIAGGMTQEQAMVAMDISNGTWFNWKKSHPEFLEAITDSDEEKFLNVEKSLYKRAIGYEYKETHTSIEKDGERVKKVQKVITKQQAASDTAIMFFLTNKRPQNWKRMPDENQQDNDAPVIPIQVQVMPAVSDVKITIGNTKEKPIE